MVEETISKLLKGDSYYRNKGVNHNVINNNNYEYSFIEIEFKFHLLVKKSDLEKFEEILENKKIEKKQNYLKEEIIKSKVNYMDSNKPATSSAIKLYMFQTGTIKTKVKFIKMNQGEEPYEIPIPWFLIKHPQGDVIIDGGMPIEAALDKHKHWGSLVDVYDPVMKASEWCRDQVKTVNTNPEDVKNVIQTHLHLDHSGAIGHFPNATHITQRIEYDYAFNPDWIAVTAPQPSKSPVSYQLKMIK